MLPNLPNLSENKKPGFSIIEIMIVLMIAGLIIAGAVMGFKFYNNQKVSNTELAMTRLDSALSQYSDKIGDYPEDLDELVHGPKDPAKANLFQIEYANAKDLKDAWGKEFEYIKNPKGSEHPYTLETFNPVVKKTMYSPQSGQ